MPDDTLRVLSLNIQVGLRATRYRHYVTQAWRHLLPSRGVRETLDAIAGLARDYDVVALQEADAGSLRSAQLNQVEYLAQAAGFPHWHAAVNRNLGPFAQHCLGLLSRPPLRVLQHHALPGRMPGRGALEVEIAPLGQRPLRMIVTHLSLGRESRRRQLTYLGALVSPGDAVLLLGDLNCEPAELATDPALQAAGLRCTQMQPTFPSWQPRRSLDHILVTAAVDVLQCATLDVQLSDHLPVTAQLRLRSSGTAP
jgi:endonuclease/exonuclease/phosphatase family metal-dependent hydrolase